MKILRIGRKGLRRIGAVALIAVLLDTSFLDLSLHAHGTLGKQVALGQSARTEDTDAQNTESVRCELTGDYDLFVANVHRKDAAALAHFVLTKTTKDLQVKQPDGSILQFLNLSLPPSERRGFDQPLTGVLLLKDLPAAGQWVPDYVVESASIHIDKLVVSGDRALVLTTGTGVGTNYDNDLPENLPRVKF